MVRFCGVAGLIFNGWPSGSIGIIGGYSGLINSELSPTYGEKMSATTASTRTNPKRYGDASILTRYRPSGNSVKLVAGIAGDFVEFSSHFVVYWLELGKLPETKILGVIPSGITTDPEPEETTLGVAANISIGMSGWMVAGLLEVPTEASADDELDSEELFTETERVKF